MEKKIRIKGQLSLNKKVLTELNNRELNSINGGGVKRSKRKEGDCNYSRDNHTQCGEVHSRSGICCANPI